MKQLIAVGFVVLVFVGQAASVEKDEGKGTQVFQAGAAISNITPFLGTELIGGFSCTPAAWCWMMGKRSWPL